MESMILLANLGNRNITYKGKQYIYRKDFSFLEWSKKLLDTYEQCKEDLDINIINPLITGENKPSKIVFFYSDQAKFDTRTDQDTIYEAQIIKKLLIDKYGFEEEQISLLVIDSKVIDNGALIRYYRKVLKELSLKYKNYFFIICDAGGTAQQKMSLKLIAEFILSENKYEVKYTENNKLISDVNIDEYRKIINQEQAIKLIHVGEYVGAAQLLDFNNLEITFKKKNNIEKLFAYCYFRFYNNDSLAGKLVNNLKTKNQLILKDKKHIPLTENKDLTNFYKYKDIKRILDFFFKAKFYFELGNYSAAILNFSRFYEVLFESYFGILFDKKIYGTTKHQEEKQKVNFKKKVEKDFGEIIQKCRDRYDKPDKKIYRIKMNELPTQVIIAKGSKNKTMSKIGKILSPYIIFTDDALEKNKLINLVRNKIAHEGKLITQKDIENELSYFLELLELIERELQPEIDNLFVDLNNYLEKRIRQN